jgi:MoaA/NifB/PqqE/SkfB family radical SAM enzyme
MYKPPQFLFLDINYQCNLKCKHCKYWVRKETILPTHITIEQRSLIIKEFSNLNPNGTVVICGGESLLNPERYFPITIQCRKLGLECFSVINGTKITDEKSAERMILDGATQITLSLNSHIPEIHDYSRGFIGSYDLVINAIKLLVAARKKLDKTNPIYVMAVVCELNYRELDAMYDLVLNELGADKLKLNFLQPTFAPTDSIRDNDIFYKENIIKNYNELLMIIKQCNEKYNLNLNPKWLNVVETYHSSVNESNNTKGWCDNKTKMPICNSYDRNIMIDMHGAARLCFSIPYIGTYIRKYGDLTDFWNNNNDLRQEMSLCTKPCGISHSVRKENATLK